MAFLSDIISSLAVLSCGADETRVGWRRIWTGRPSEEPNSPPHT